MACIVSGTITYSDSAGVAQPVVGAKLWVRPSRTDFDWTDDAGTTWRSWQKNPNNPVGHEYDIAITTIAGGAWSVKLPWTDSEIRLPVGATVPSVFWNIIDDNTGKVFYGPLVEATVAASKTLNTLTQLGSPNNWRIAGAAQSALPVAGGYEGTVSFTDASDEIAVSFPTRAGSPEYRVLHGLETDNSATRTPYVLNVKEGSRTVDGFTFKLSQAPPSGKTVKAWFLVRVPS